MNSSASRFLPLLFAAIISVQAAEQNLLPIRGLHCFPPKKSDLDNVDKFIRDTLPKEGVNTLILEFGYDFNYQSHPEMGNTWSCGAPELKRLAKACRESGIKLIPQFNCLGHQSWAKQTHALLKKHPEFDEMPNAPADNKGLYCRSWCPEHPDVHKIVFDLIDELCDACEADVFHAGLDEVFIIADEKCARCGGKDPAGIFAAEVKRIRDHLAEKKRTMWMWGDRLIDGNATKIGKWEASTNGTHTAIDKIPKDVVICDWHYEKAHRTPEMFAQKGFTVLACPWKDGKVALDQLKLMRELAAKNDIAARSAGLIQTTWVGLSEFIKAYNSGEGTKDAVGSAVCFKELFKAMREEKPVK
jgi:hypothetical protein